MSDQPTITDPTPEPQHKPNEQGTVSVEGFIRIYDPNDQEVFLESRA